MLYAAMKVVVLTIFLHFIVPPQSSAYVSPNVSPHHWSYEALERLAAAGIIDTVMLNRKPLSRLDMAEMLASIPKTTPIPGNILKEDISRLSVEYQDELRMLGVVPSNRQPASYRIADPMSLEWIYSDLDGFSRTPRENYGGEYYYGNMTGQLKVSAWARFGRHIVVDVAPEFTVHSDDTDITFQEAYLKGAVGNLEVEAGRDTLWWGPGYHGSLILSDNAPPFNLLKMGSRRPFHLPGWLRAVGLWDISGFLTQLEEQREFPQAKLTGLRVGLIPFKFMEVSLTRSVLFGGEGRPALDFPDYLKMFFAIGENEPGRLDNDQLAGYDFRIAVPIRAIGSGLSLYGQLIGEDEADGLPSSYGFSGGIFICDLLNRGFVDLRVEYAEHPLLEEKAAWYAHHVYTTGYTYHQRVLGYPMGGFEADYFNDGIFAGSDAWDLFLRLTIHLGQDMEMGLQYDYESHRGSAPAMESKQEMIVDISSRMSDNVLLKAGQEYEKIGNWRGVEGREVDNFYLWGGIELAY